MIEEQAESMTSTRAGRTWVGKGVRLEKDDAGTRLCILPAEEGGEARCFSSSGLDEEGVETLADLLAQIGAIDAEEGGEEEE